MPRSGRSPFGAGSLLSFVTSMPVTRICRSSSSSPISVTPPSPPASISPQSAIAPHCRGSKFGFTATCSGSLRFATTTSLRRRQPSLPIMFGFAFKFILRPTITHRFKAWQPNLDKPALPRKPEFRSHRDFDQRRGPCSLMCATSCQ
jgi:hypothetical protein